MPGGQKANLQACLAEVSRFAAGENERAAQILSGAAERAEDARRKAASLAGLMGEEAGKLAPGAPSPDHLNLSMATRAEYLRYVNQTKAEQTKLVAASTAFREVASAEIQNRRSSGSTLTGLQNDAIDRNNRMGSVGGDQQTPGSAARAPGSGTPYDSSFLKDVKLPSSLPGAVATGVPGGGSETILSGGLPASAAASSLPAGARAARASRAAGAATCSSPH